MDNAKLIAELENNKRAIVSQIKILKGYIKKLDAVVEMFTLLSPKKIALNAINKDPDKIWTINEIVNELRYANEIRKLQKRGLEGKTYLQISRNVLNNLLRQRILERVGRGQYKKVKEKTTTWGATVINAPNSSDKHKRWRQKQQAKGLCIKCSRPATSKTLCDYHRQKKRESYQQQKESK